MPGVSAEVRRARSSSFRLLPFDQSPALLMNAWPRNVVPAGTRHEVHHRPADVRLAQAAGDGHRDLVDVDRIQDVGRHAAAVERRRDRHAVDRHAPFVDRAAARREEGHRRRRGERAVVDGQAWDGIQQGADGAVPRNGRDHVGAEHRLALRGLDVDDRCLTGDRDRLRERADTHVDWNRQRGGAAELDALTLDDVEAGQRERQRVRAGIQTGNAVLARAVGDGRAHLFDEGGAGRLDGHARQHAARLVPDGACKGALCKCKGRQQDSRHQNQDGLRRSTHGVLLQ